MVRRFAEKYRIWPRQGPSHKQNTWIKTHDQKTTWVECALGHCLSGLHGSSVWICRTAWHVAFMVSHNASFTAKVVEMETHSVPKRMESTSIYCELNWVPSGYLTVRHGKWPIEINGLPIKNGGSFHGYVSHNQMVHDTWLLNHWIALVFEYNLQKQPGFYVVLAIFVVSEFCVASVEWVGHRCRSSTSLIPH